jgi:hypothetical protein
MTNPTQNNDLINLSEPEPSPRHEKPIRIVQQLENEPEIEEVIGSETFTDPEAFLSSIPGYRKEIDAEFGSKDFNENTYVRYDWFKSPITHLIVFLLFCLTTWKLVAWGYPTMLYLIDKEDIRHVPDVIFICLLPLIVYAWFLKYRYSPGWDTDDGPKSLQGDRLTWPW